MSCTGFGHCCRAKCWQQFVPHDVQHGLHIGHATGDRQDRILVGHDDAILAECAIAAIAVVSAAPELVTIALLPVRIVVQIVAPIRDLFAGGRFDPAFGNQLLAVPQTFLQIELTELGDVLSLDAQPPAASVDPTRASFPSRIFDAQWLEQTRVQILQQRHAGNLLQDSRAHICGHAVVEKVGAGRMLDRMGQKDARPVVIVHPRWLGVVAGGHGQQIVHAHVGQVRTNFGG